MRDVASKRPSAGTDLGVCTPWVCRWARSRLGRRGGISRSAGTGPVGTASTYRCSRRTRSLPGTLQRQPRWGVSVLMEAKSNPPKNKIKASGFLLGEHSLWASLRTSPSGQVSWHLPRWRKNPARHRVQKFLAKQESHSDLHSWQRNTDPPPAFI